MDKKQVAIGIILALLTGGFFLIAILIWKSFCTVKIKHERAQLETYVKDYFRGNEKLLAFVGTLSDDEVHVLMNIISKVREENTDIEWKTLNLPEFFEQKVKGLVE
ncbi:hypothetical protein [Companilactobacillus baiquanensis]|uniref:Uncharacterized protein n=1 Tax=Companilactobacillus baiquanensis TaxID=2486005 RepID=A0ABW1UVS3_9LACO|nr:hypothetical protein [Companilactobacillus baiquanensis]